MKMFIFKLIWRETPLNSSYIFLLDMNFENVIVGLHVLIISSMLSKFWENKKSITMSSIKYLNFQFFGSKIMHKK